MIYTVSNIEYAINLRKIWSLYLFQDLFEICTLLTLFSFTEEATETAMKYIKKEIVFNVKVETSASECSRFKRIHIYVIEWNKCVPTTSKALVGYY